MKRTRLVLVLGLLTGCAGLIGVPDLTLDESPPDGGSIDTGPLGDGNIGSPGDTGPAPIIDGSTTDPVDANGGTDAADANVDSATCDLSKVETDPLNCGACGTSCLGGECRAGKCDALALANIPDAPIWNLVEYGPSVYVSTFITLTTQQGGIWVIPKAGGNAVKYVDKRYAGSMVVLGDTLYFMVGDTRFTDAGTDGGLWKCNLKGPIPCVPELVAPADDANGLSTDKGYIYFGDNSSDASDDGLKRLAPEAGAMPTLWRPGYGFPSHIWASDEEYYYLNTFRPSNPANDRASMWSVYADAGGTTLVSEYPKRTANEGLLIGTANALYYTAYDFGSTSAAVNTNGGVVRRVSRPGTAGTTPCDYGGTKNVRPRGLHLADDRIYWTNQGEPTPPAGNPTPGSVNYCPLAGCCPDPILVWTAGIGRPMAVTSDSQALYWAEREGTVYKIRKP